MRDIVFELDLSGTLMQVKWNGADIADGATSRLLANGTVLGGKGLNAGSRELTYTIINIGQTALQLTGSPLVSISGAQASDFVVTIQPAATVPGRGSTTFTIRFDPSAIGVREAKVSIPHGDSPGSAYDFAIQGEGLGGGAGVLGNDSDGAFARNIDDTQIHGNRFQAPVAMKISELRAKVLELAGIFKCAVYSDTNGLPDHLLRSSVEVVKATNGWNTFALTSPLDVTAGDSYWLVIWSDTPGARIQADPVGGAYQGIYSYTDLGGNWPDPISLPNLIRSEPRTYCIYAEGTPLGTAPGPAMANTSRIRPNRVRTSVAVASNLCSTASAGGGFVNTTMANQTGTFSAQFDATPSVAPLDSVMALSSGAQTAYSGFACLARFNTDGHIDARNGGSYAADNVIPYSANVKYHFRLVVNVPAHTYSVYVTPAGSTERTVGANFAFRTDQNAVTNLDHWGVIVDATSAGTNTVCNFQIP